MMIQMSDMDIFNLERITTRKCIVCIPHLFALISECTIYTVSIIWLPLVLINAWAMCTMLIFHAAYNGYMLGSTVQL